MKILISTIALWMCFASVSGQVAISDTVYIYERVTVYDTIVIRDTIRVKKQMAMPVAHSKSINEISFTPPTEKNLSPPATFSENSIILHESNKQKNIKIMKLNIANFLSATLISAQSMAGLQAQDTKPAGELEMFPMQFSIVYPMTTQGDQTVNYRYHLSFNLFSGKAGAVTGFEYGSLFNQIVQDVKGVQIGGLANRTHELTGVQSGGLGNMSHHVTGIQAGGLGNISHTVKGVQLGGIINMTDSVVGIQFGGITNLCKEADGIQFAGITNLSERTKGVQFAGITNVSESATGIQFGGIGNVSEEVTGLQFGGIFNRTGTLRGFQFAGIVNITDTIEKGGSVALINIVRKGYYRAWEFSFADYMNANVSFKMGTKMFYTILAAGATFMEDQLWVAGFGFGNRTALSPRIDFQPEIAGYQYFPCDFKNVRNTSFNHLKLGLIFKLNERLGLVVAPSVYYFYANVDENSAYYKFSPAKPFYEKYRAEHYYRIGDESFRIPSHVFGFGAGISVGLIIN